MDAGTMPAISTQRSTQSSARAAERSGRTLDSDIPELKPFLKPGMKVLDVGCGLGTITLGVAEAVDPGTVVGIDPVSDYIGRSQKLAARVKRSGSIRFQVGDGHRLDFPDDTFDVVYSHTVLHFLLDPVAALKEQRRVTRKGGWVIASGVRDWGGAPFTYPPSPSWNKVYEALVRYWDANLTEHRAKRKDPVAPAKEESEDSRFLPMLACDPYAGRKCMDWFTQAGLSELRIEIQGRVHYQGHRESPPSPLDNLVVEEPKTDIEKVFAEFIKSILSGITAKGLLDEQTIGLAIEEARAWYKDPGAFRFFPEFFAAGRVP